MKVKLQNFIKTIAKTPVKIMFSYILIGIILYAISFAYTNFNIFIGFLLLLLPSLTYFAMNMQIDGEKQKRTAFGHFKVAFFIGAIYLINAILCMALHKLATLTLPNGTTTFNLLKILLVAVDLLALFMVQYTTNTPFVESAFDDLMNTDVFAKIGINIFSRTLKPGDVVVCKNADSGQPVILPCKDRFLHMLILGPTGCGKTSQTILPMLNQDMQNREAGITVLEPKGDLAEKAYAMAQYYHRPAIYFNPVSSACPTFNPLYGKEEDIIENMVTTFKMLNPDSQTYFQDMNEQLLRNSLKVLKRLKGNTATLIDLSRLVSNSMGEGRNMVMAFYKKPAETEALRKENEDVANYFLNDYFQEKSKSYENTSGIRSQIAKIVSNKFLRKVLNPENGKSDIDFDKHLEEGGVICISTAQGKLRDLGKFLGYFIILNFQSSVFKRPGNEYTRRHHFLYIDEFQTYSNPGYADMLTQGRSYRVASQMATQNRALIGMGSGRAGDDFIELVSTNARNVVIYPGGNYHDAKYYSDQFGEILDKKIKTSISQQRYNPLTGGGNRPQNQSRSLDERNKPRFSPTDIMQRKFGEITYAFIADNTLQPAGVGRISYIDKDLNTKLDKMIEENNILMELGWDPNECRDFERGCDLYENIDWDKILELYKEKMAKDESEEKEKEKQSQGTKMEIKFEDPSEPEAPKDNQTNNNNGNNSAPSPADDEDFNIGDEDDLI